ncbi:MAG: beta-ketoacyl synthase N-terminal-like domain-containing protein, partial [Telluria sp.]
MTMRVAVVAMACEFPGASTPEELWATALYGRRCFRSIPPERLATQDYPNVDSDGIYPIEAGLLEGYTFDRAKFRVPQSAFLRTDMAHWLALDVASRALGGLSSGSVEAERDNIAVIVANTLTGEFSRAQVLRYRWPFVARAMRTAASDIAFPPEQFDVFMAATETAYKEPLPVPDEDSLAGGLSNTIAGRIANHHGLRGGAHTVDGACASSLVAVTSACERL